MLIVDKFLHLNFQRGVLRVCFFSWFIFFLICSSFDCFRKGFVFQFWTRLLFFFFEANSVHGALSRLSRALLPAGIDIIIDSFVYTGAEFS